MTTEVVSAKESSAEFSPADFEMSSRAHAIEAVDTLLTAGHSGALLGLAIKGSPRNTIRVPIASPEARFEVSRLVHSVDPDAQPPPGSYEELPRPARRAARVIPL